MSMKRLGLLHAVSSPGLYPASNITASTNSARAGSSSLHGNVNVLLGGAMLSGVILIVFLICYCCHRNMRKSASRNARYWHDDPELPLEVFTVDGQLCYEVTGVFLTSESRASSFDRLTCPETPSPPPAYHDVIKDGDTKTKSDIEADIEKIDVVLEKTDDDNSSGLPSYEVALRLEAHGYV